MTHQIFKRIAVLAAIAACGLSVQAADWSDTSIAYRTGTNYSEPYNTNAIGKNILDLVHVSGYKYGTNYFLVEMLLSDSTYPSAAGSQSGAQEVYVMYRHTLDLEKISGKSFKFGPVRGMGITVGFDLDTTTDTGYNSKKRMLVAGPKFMIDVPGFLDVSLLALWENNNPSVSGIPDPGYPKSRFNYEVHPMINLAWGIPFSIGSLPLSFEGFANFIAAKGKNELGFDTAAETNIDMQLMYDLSSVMGASPKTFKIGVEYQYWKNKFGNNSDTVPGAFANTPMVRAEYHF